MSLENDPAPPVDPNAPAATEPAAAVEPTPAPEPDPAPAPEPSAIPAKAEMPAWGWDRLHEETNKRRAIEAEKERIAAENKQLRERLERANGAPQPPAAQPAAEPQQTRQEFEDAVTAGVRQRALADARNDIIGKGYQDFGKAEFDKAANILFTLNCTSDDFVSDVLAVNRGDAHKLLAALAADPEKAVHLASIDSRSRIAELTRMNMTQQQTAEPKPALAVVPPAPKPVSKAPAPAPRVEPSSTPGDPNDLMDDSISDDEWYSRYRKVRKV